MITVYILVSTEAGTVTYTVSGKRNSYLVTMSVLNCWDDNAMTSPLEEEIHDSRP